MKERPLHFLASDKIDHDGEVFDYINELHDYLWRFVRTVFPAVGGSLRYYVDSAIRILEQRDANGKDKLECIPPRQRTFEGRTLDDMSREELYRALQMMCELWRGVK